MPAWAAIDKARQANMPRDNVDRAVKKGLGDLDGVNYEEGTFEGYGPNGVAVIVEFMTDNRTRTVADVRHTFAKYGGNLGVSGSVAFLFERKGLLSFPLAVDFEKLFEAALEAGAEDVKDEGDSFEVITDPATFMEVRDALVAAGLEFETAEVTMLPQTQVQLAGKQAESMLKLMDKLEDNDDVQNVYANFDIADDELEKLDV